MKSIDVSELKGWIENWFEVNRYYHPYAKNNNIPITELYDILEQMPSAHVNAANLPQTCNQIATDCISRQAAIALADGLKDDLLAVRNRLIDLPSAQPEPPPYVAEIESEYRKAVNMPHIKKPLAKALFEVWKKHDREDAERRTDETD